MGPLTLNFPDSNDGNPTNNVIKPKMLPFLLPRQCVYRIIVASNVSHSTFPKQVEVRYLQMVRITFNYTTSCRVQVYICSWSNFEA